VPAHKSRTKWDEINFEVALRLHTTSKQKLMILFSLSYSSHISENICDTSDFLLSMIPHIFVIHPSISLGTSHSSSFIILYASILHFPLFLLRNKLTGFSKSSDSLSSSIARIPNFSSTLALSPTMVNLLFAM